MTSHLPGPGQEKALWSEIENYRIPLLAFIKSREERFTKEPKEKVAALKGSDWSDALSAASPMLSEIGLPQSKFNIAFFKHDEKEPVELKHADQSYTMNLENGTISCQEPNVMLPRGIWVVAAERKK